jgi:hypothetical protein
MTRRNSGNLGASAMAMRIIATQSGRVVTLKSTVANVNRKSHGSSTCSTSLGTFARISLRRVRIRVSKRFPLF